MRWLILAILFVGCGSAEAGLVTSDGERCEYTGSEDAHNIEFRNESDVEASLALLSPLGASGLWALNNPSSVERQIITLPAGESKKAEVDEGTYRLVCRTQEKESQAGLVRFD